MLVADHRAHRIAIAEIGRAQFVVCASGRLEGDAAGELREVLSALAAEGGARIWLDLAGVTARDDQALEAVAGAATELAARGGELAVVTLDPRLQTLLGPGGVVEQVETT
jgi:anti-anti-sigma factor